MGGVGALIVVVLATGIVSAAWLGSDSAQATVTAATIGVTLMDGGTTLGSNFTFNGDYCGNMLPGDSCTKTFTVKNTGTVSETLSAAASNSVPGCYTNTVSALDGKLEIGDLHLDYDPNETDTLDVTTTLDSAAPSSCQGQTNTVTVTASATPSASPRD